MQQDSPLSMLKESDGSFAALSAILDLNRLPGTETHDYTATHQQELLDNMAFQLQAHGTVDERTLEEIERVLFVESATAMLMADVQDYEDLATVLQNLKSLHVSIIATFMPYPSYHAHGRKWISEYFKKNQIYCSWLVACEEAQNQAQICITPSTQSP